MVFRQRIADSFDNSSSLRSTRKCAKVLPLGFRLTCLLQTRRLARYEPIVLIVSAGLSSTVEVLQAFLPSRSPLSPIFLIIVLVVLASFFCAFICSKILFSYTSALIKKSKDCLSIKKLTAGFIGYMNLIFVSERLAKCCRSLRNWDSTFPLLLGNEQTGVALAGICFWILYW